MSYESRADAGPAAMPALPVHAAGGLGTASFRMASDSPGRHLRDPRILDLQLTLMGGSLYRLLGNELCQGYERAKSRTIFHDFIDAHATLDIGDQEITVRFHKRAHNPLLFKAGFNEKDPAIPWLGNRTLNLVFG